MTPLLRELVLPELRIANRVSVLDVNPGLVLTADRLEIANDIVVGAFDVRAFQRLELPALRRTERLTLSGVTGDETIVLTALEEITDSLGFGIIRDAAVGARQSLELPSLRRVGYFYQDGGLPFAEFRAPRWEEVSFSFVEFQLGPELTYLEVPSIKDAGVSVMLAADATEPVTLDLSSVEILRQASLGLWFYPDLWSPGFRLAVLGEGSTQPVRILMEDAAVSSDVVFCNFAIADELKIGPGITGTVRLCDLPQGSRVNLNEAENVRFLEAIRVGEAASPLSALSGLASVVEVWIQYSSTMDLDLMVADGAVVTFGDMAALYGTTIVRGAAGVVRNLTLRAWSNNGGSTGVEWDLSEVESGAIEIGSSNHSGYDGMWRIDLSGFVEGDVHIESDGLYALSLLSYERGNVSIVTASVSPEFLPIRSAPELTGSVDFGPGFPCNPFLAVEWPNVSYVSCP